MSDHKALQPVLNRVTQQLQQPDNDSQIPAGSSFDKHADVDQKSAINQIFELFRFNYHNQFLKAFPDHDTVIMAKQLWSRLLVDYDANTMLKAAELVVKQQKFLPNVHDVLEACEQAQHIVLGVPDPHAAYVEACRAPSPKAEYNWTHPAVYYAGRASDWFMLANEPEQVAYPVFERNYALLLDRIRNGEELNIELPKAIPEKIERPLERKEQAQNLRNLMKESGLE